MGIVAVAQGDPAGAVGLLEESIALSEQLGHQYALAVSRQALGSALLDLGDANRASVQLSRALTLHQELEELARDRRHPRGARQARRRQRGGGARCGELGAASAIREAMGAPLHAVDEIRHAQTVAAAQRLIGDERYEELYRDGLATRPTPRSKPP